MHLGSDSATCDQHLGNSSAVQQHAPLQRLGDTRSARLGFLPMPALQLALQLSHIDGSRTTAISTAAACTSAATRRHAISAWAAAQLFSSMHLGSDSASREQRGWAFWQAGAFQ
jgi:hypothetical protein